MRREPMRSAPPRRLRLAAAVALGAAAALAAAGPGEELEARLKAKLEQPFVREVAWSTDREEALGRAEREGKLVFAYFTRSYEP